MEFVIKEQAIRQIDNEPIAADAVNFPKAVFTFSDEWSAPIYAVFRNGRTAIIVPLESDGETYVCNVPHEVLTEGHIVVSCYNTIMQDGELIKRLTTMQSQPIRVFRSGTLDGQATSTPTPTLFEKYLNSAKEELAETVAEAVPELIQEIQSEQTAREKSDKELSDRIDTKANTSELQEEQAARIKTDDTQQTTIENLTQSISDERTAREEADTALSEEIDTKIAEAKSIIPTRYLVMELPTTDIDVNGTYLVPSDEPEEDNVYTEYAYIKDAWEIIGNPYKVDLSGYIRYDTDLTQYGYNTDFQTFVADMDNVTTTQADNAIVVSDMQEYIEKTLPKELEAKSDNIIIAIGKETTIEMEHNTETRYGEVSELALVLPDEIPDEYISSVVFTSGETATNLTYPDTVKMSGEDCSDGVFAPIASKEYTVIWSYSGTRVSGIVGGVAI